jgi:hypothetical protein
MDEDRDGPTEAERDGADEIVSVCRDVAGGFGFDDEALFALLLGIRKWLGREQFAEMISRVNDRMR